MNSLEFLKLLQKRKQTLVSAVIICLAVAMPLVVFQSFKYEASFKLLVSQEFTSGTDAYTISQSNDYLSKLLARVVESQSFYNEVVDSGFQINKDYFRKGADKEEEIERWNKVVEAGSPNIGNGIIEIQILHPDRQQADQIAQGVNYILQTKNQEYHSLNDSIFLKTIDGPIVSERPVKPNIFVIFPFTIVLALFLAGVYIYYFPEDKYDLKIISKNGFFFVKKRNGVKTRVKDRGSIKDLGKRTRRQKQSQSSKQELSWEKADIHSNPKNTTDQRSLQDEDREEKVFSDIESKQETNGQLQESDSSDASDPYSMQENKKENKE